MGENVTISDISKKLSTLSFSRANGLGIRDLEVFDNIINATLIKIIYAYIYDYNDLTNEIEKKQISVVNEIGFLIDFETKIISIFGQVTNVTQIKSFFKTIFSESVRISTYELTIPQICDKLLKQRLNFNYKTISVNNFNYENGVFGKFTGVAISNKVVQDLINNYKTDVQRIGLDIYLPDYRDPVEISVGNMGSLKINCEDEEFDEIFLNLKDLLYT
jgi:hypothetical protein